MVLNNLPQAVVKPVDKLLIKTCSRKDIRIVLFQRVRVKTLF